MAQTEKSESDKKPAIERRLQPRREIDNYPVIIKKTDGTKIDAYISNISAMGFQIKCDRLSAYTLTGRKVGLLENKDLPDIELAAILAYKKGIKKINSICKLRYAAMSVGENPDYAFAIGLQVIQHKGNSFEVVRELLYGQSLPHLPGKKQAIKKP